MNHSTNPPTALDDDLPDELDFTKLGKGERGKFYFPKETHHIPFYLDPAMQESLIAKADAKSKPSNP